MPAEITTVLRAHPHQFGPGKVHIFEDDKTLCGKPREYCPGEVGDGRLDQVTCKVCQRSRESRERFAEQQAQWEQRQAERDRDHREWWAWYDGYLQTPEWRQRRALGGFGETRRFPWRSSAKRAPIGGAR